MSGFGTTLPKHAEVLEAYFLFVIEKGGWKRDGNSVDTLLFP